MPVCPKCCSPLRKRTNAQGKSYHCKRHGFVRNIGTPLICINFYGETPPALVGQIIRPTKIKLNIEAQNV